MEALSNSLSFIIPALNEEGNIRATCEGIAALAQKHLSDYEILVFDDASQDRTGAIVRELQKENRHISLFRNSVTQGLGYNYRAGILKARCRYAIMVPGDNEVISESLEEIFKQLGATDIIICYSSNPEVRPRLRQMISKIFTAMLNLLFGLKVRYYNGPAVVRTDLARDYLPSTHSFAYMAVILVKLLRLGHTHCHSTFSLRARKFGRTMAFEFRNVGAVIRDILELFWQVHVRRSIARHPVSADPPSGLGDAALKATAKGLDVRKVPP